METVLTAIVVIFIIVFAALTLTQAFVSAQATISVTWQEMQTRMDQQARTLLSPIGSEVTSNGAIISLTLRNDGATKLADFDRWDFMLQYYDNATPSDYHINWLPYKKSNPSNNEWTIQGIYMDAAKLTKEVYEPGILNPGEEIVLRVTVSPAVGSGSTVQTIVSTTNGKSVSEFSRRNVPPVLVNNLGLTLVSHETRPISRTLLAVTDEDDSAKDLIYVITALPTQGTLNLGTTFTQADIDSGLLNYKHTGLGSDSFSFTVTDGEDTIGPFNATITVTNAPPILEINDGLTITTGGTGVIDSTLLTVTDEDNTPENLIYTVMVAPTQGTLSLSTTFTQADIDNGLLTYTHTGTGLDTFAFSVSDGEAVIGMYWFNITVE